MDCQRRLFSPCGKGDAPRLDPCVSACFIMWLSPPRARVAPRCASPALPARACHAARTHACSPACAGDCFWSCRGCCAHGGCCLPAAGCSRAAQRRRVRSPRAAGSKHLSRLLLTSKLHRTLQAEPAGRFQPAALLQACWRCMDTGVEASDTWMQASRSAQLVAQASHACLHHANT
jgi:hypothetical protein